MKRTWLLSLAMLAQAALGVELSQNTVAGRAALLKVLERIPREGALGGPPGYLPLKHFSLQPELREVVYAAAAASGGVVAMDGAIDAGSAVLAAEIRADLGVRVAVLIDIRHQVATGTKRAEWLRAEVARVRGLLDKFGNQLGEVDDVLFDAESIEPDLELVRRWRVEVYEVFPSARVSCYHWPSWSASWQGSGASGMWSQTPPADTASCNLLYSESAATVSLARKETAELAANRLPIMGYIADFTYGPIETEDGKAVWGSRMGERLTRGHWWLAGRHLATMAQRPPGIAGIVQWRAFGDARCDWLAWAREVWEPLCCGWADKPMPPLPGSERVVSADLDGDGDVDADDYRLFQLQFTGPSGEVPEPIPTPQPTPTATPSPTPGSLPPIAAWDAIDHQDETRVGVVAHHRDGVREVRFYWGGRERRVTAPTINPATNVHEFWTEVDYGEVEAIAIGSDGGVCALPPIQIGTTLDLLIDRGMRTVSVPPGASIRAALAQCSGGWTVVLQKGEHIWDGSPSGWGRETIQDVDDWVTIYGATSAGPRLGGIWTNTGEPGEPMASIVGMTPNGAPLLLDWVRIEGIRITASAAGFINAESSGTERRRCWLRNCTVEGGPALNPHPVGQNWRGPLWITESRISNMRRGTGLGGRGPDTFLRNVVFTNTREDVAQSVPIGLNVTVVGVNPGSSGEHADVVQGPPASSGTHLSGWIWQGLRATDVHYQGIFARSGALTDGMALVDCTIEMQTPIRPDGGAALHLAGVFNHLVIQDCTFIGGPAEFSYESTAAQSFRMTNSRVSGCRFDDLRFYKGASGMMELPADAFRQNRFGSGAPIDGLPR